MTKEQLKSQAEWLFAFGDPTRVAIVRTLATGDKIVTDIAQLVKTEIVNVSHHLKILKKAEVVTFERDGRHMWYSLVRATATAVELVMTHPSGMSVTLPLN